ncbi:hypothetical protein DUNSADRAFT_4381 [Dunaliella salina]|uniref:Uncharacterized protein n=1 Tax=Dunaliella salina TaxID=3046 RepID=A0ABQ7GSC1_DUNSA|nr:hypothetical protein DUNSADRAFT_4381 [Dunaliella salina]|eukprot:KAF5837465.1 hypothetical protein DUNSADRAFT_4381 [Dunaliella salina]
MGCGASQPIQASSPGDEERLRKLDAERIQRLELELDKARSSQARTNVHKPSHEDSNDVQHQALAQTSTAPENAAKSPFWTQKRRATFKAVVKGGVTATWALCEEFKDVLPFPGGIGVALVGQLAQLISTALANKDNLEALLERAAELMDVIIEKHVSQEDLAAKQGGCRASKTGSRKYRQLMERLRDVLDVILEYTREYCDRNFIMKLLMTSHDRDQYQAMVDDLAQLMVDAHFSVSMDTHSMTSEVLNMSTEMKSMLEQVRSQTPYTDCSSEIKRMVDELGGIEAVLSSEAKMDQVINHLDAGQQITIAVLKNQVQAAFLAAAAGKDEGVHTLIRHTDMRTFWKQFFKGLPKVDWDIWWSAFPNRLVEVVQDKAVVEQVMARLSKDADLQRFQEFAEKADPETVSVREVELAFPYGVSIPEALDRAFGVHDESGSEATAISGRAGSTSKAHESSSRLQQQGSLSGKMGGSTLPKLDKLYVGRE